MSNKNSFTEGKILSPLLLFAVPVLGSMILQSLYGAVDLFIVGKYGITPDVSAVSTGAHVMSLLTQAIVGLSVGTTVMVGQHIGAGRKDEAGKDIAGGIKLFTVIGIIMTAVVLMFSTPICKLYNAPVQAFEQTNLYVIVCGIGLVFIIAYNVLGSIFRGIGDSRTPLLAVFIACVLNIGGDILFVKTLGLHAMGAALATTLSQAVSVIICFFVIKKRGLPFEFGKESFKNTRNAVIGTIKMGAPIALSNVMVSFSFSVIMSLVNNLGVIESASVGVAEKCCAFIMLVPSAFAQSLSAFVAQNVGARQIGRANKGLRYCIMLSFSIAVVIAYISFFHGNILTGIFTKDPLVIAGGWEYMKAYAIDVLLTSFFFCFTGYCNGRGYTTFVMAQGIISAFCIRMPMSFLMSSIQPVSLFKIGLATPTASAAQVVAYIIFLSIIAKKSKQEVQ